MLRPLHEPKTRNARFCAYDLEWIPGEMRLRLIGVYDASGYRSYAGDSNVAIVEAFLDAELTKKNRGTWFYAHAGGLADIQFIMEALIEHPEYRVEAAFTGSSAVIVKVKRDGMQWIFVDSLFTLKASLAKIGELLGMPKGEVEWTAPLAELREYNAQDCRILYEGISRFEDVLLDLGSELKMTLAACAMRLFRRRYLQKDVPTHQGLNRKLRDAYVGGRVEVFYKKPVEDWKAGKTTPGYYFDVNSCYPHAMTMPMPERFLKSLRRLPTRRDGTLCYFADVTIDVPETRVPVLPLVHGGSLYFPTGRRRAWYAGPELERAIACGAEIQKVHECLVYAAFDDLADFAEDVYGLRMRSKGFQNYNYKILNNSCYGKFCERQEKMALLLNPDKMTLLKAKRAHLASEGRLRDPKKYEKGRLHLLTPGMWLLEKEVPVHAAHVPIGAYVTSHARALLHEHLTRAGVDPLYCDTDGFMLPPEGAGAYCAHDPKYCKGGSCAGCMLGGLKREKVLADALFFAPKLYYLLEECGEEVKETVKAKGFGGICACLRPLGYRTSEDEDGAPVFTDGGEGYACEKCGMGRKDKIGREAFEKMIAGDMAIANRMLRLKQLYARGETTPREAPDSRHVAGSKPKRCFLPDGSSRAWTVEELERGANVREDVTA